MLAPVAGLQAPFSRACLGVCIADTRERCGGIAPVLHEQENMLLKKLALRRVTRIVALPFRGG